MGTLFSMLGYLFVTTFTPGPNTMMVFYSTSQLGFQEATPIRRGIVIGFNILLYSVGLLTYFTISLIPAIIPVLKYVGAAYMVYLSYLILRDGSKKETKIINKFGTGLLMQFANIKVLLMFLTFYSVYASSYASTLLEFLLLGLVVTVIQLLAVYAWAVLGSKMQKIIAQYNLAFRVVMALLLLQSAYHILF